LDEEIVADYIEITSTYADNAIRENGGEVMKIISLVAVIFAGQKNENIKLVVRGLDLVLVFLTLIHSDDRNGFDIGRKVTSFQRLTTLDTQKTAPITSPVFTCILEHIANDNMDIPIKRKVSPLQPI